MQLKLSAKKKDNYRIFYESFMVITHQKSIVETKRIREKESKHITIENQFIHFFKAEI